VKGWIEGTFFGAKNLLRNHLNSTGNGEAVTRTREEDAEHEERKRALQQLA